MKFNLWNSLKFQSSVFFVAVASVIVLIAGVLGESYALNQQTATKSATNLAETIRTNMEATLGRAQGDIQSFSQLLSPEDMSPALAVERRREIETALAAHLDRFPQINNYRIFNADGQTIMGGKATQASYSVAEREWFQSLKSDPGRQLAISDVLVGKGSQTSNIILGVPVRDAQGRFLGAVNAALELKLFQNLVDTPDIGESGIIAVRRNDNARLVLRRPEGSGQINQAGSSALISRVVSGEAAGQIDAVSTVDGVERRYVFRRTEGYPFAVVVGLAPRDYLAGWKVQALILGITATITVLVLSVLYLVQRRTQRHLAISEERFRTLVEGTTDWVWETDAHHRFTWFADSFEAVIGLPSSGLIGLRRWDAVSKDRDIDVTPWQIHMDDLEAHRAFRDFRYWISAGDGQSRWISISGSPRFDENGDFQGYRGSGTDITAEAEAALRLRMLSTVVDQSPVSVVITNPDGMIEYVNEHFTTVTGYAADEVRGKNSRVFASGETTAETYQDLWTTILAKKRWSGEIKNRRKNGQFHWEIMAISPVVNDEGEIVHFVAIKEDVTQRRELEDQLLRSNAELEQFAYVTSHDLRQPLRMISSYLSLIEKRMGADMTGELRGFFGFAVDGAKRMDRLILDLLEYSRTGQHASPPETVPLQSAIAEAVANLEATMDDAGASVQIARDFPTIQGTPSELVRLFQNLIGNAIKYRAPDRPPVVAVEWRDDGRFWRLAVRDNGIGIAPEDRERAFGIFQRLVTREQYEGTGIGLSICKKIVENRGGTIWIESEPGRGSTFHFTLPKAADPIQSSPGI